MTSLWTVYDAFTTIIEGADWDGWTIEETEKDMMALLKAAIPLFKIPRVDLSFSEDQTSFVSDLDNNEVQILANYMAFKWCGRHLYQWENVRVNYLEQDFSQANFIDKLIQMQESARQNAKQIEEIYYRIIKGKPFDYSRLAGG